MDDEQALWIERGAALGSFLLKMGRLLKRLCGLSKTTGIATDTAATAPPHAGRTDSPENPKALGLSD
jgi:hypothetical protein